MDVTKTFSLAGKIALITYPEYVYGPEIAKGLSDAGAKVYLAGADMEALKRIAADTKAAGVIEYHQKTEAAAEALAAEVEKTAGIPDVFVENGSNLLLKGWVHTFEDIYENLQVTQMGLILTVKHIGMLMAKKGAGSVIFVSDYAALVGSDPQNYVNAQGMWDEGFALNYGILKGEYVNYARQAAGYLGENGIRCNCLAFSPMEKDVEKGFAEQYVKHSHLKRMITADDVAAAAVFFAGDGSRFITGTTVPVDGGYTAK